MYYLFEIWMKSLLSLKKLEKKNREEIKKKMLTLKKKKNFTTNLKEKIYPFEFENDFKIIFKNSILILITNLSQVLFTMVSVVFCGHLGANQLNAISLANTVYIIYLFSSSFILLLLWFILSFSKCINVLAQTSIIGLLTACDTLFPMVSYSLFFFLLMKHLKSKSKCSQIFGGPEKFLLGIIVQKCKLKIIIVLKID